MPSGRVVHGAWDAEGEYASLQEGSRQWMLDIGATLDYRVLPSVELGLRTGFGHQSVTAPGVDATQTSFGDTLLRVRWEALDEPPPYGGAPVFSPALALVATLRAPTGPVLRAGAAGPVSTASGTTGAIGSSAANQGLGAWEPALALDVQQTLTRRVRLGLLGEAAYRFADTALGIERHLSPRVLGELSATYLVSAAWAAGVMTDLGWEGPVAYDGVRRAGTAMRLWTAGVYAYHSWVEEGLRVGAVLRVAPPVDGISVNAVATTSLGVSVGAAF
jgi:hypothetical protein